MTRVNPFNVTHDIDPVRAAAALTAAYESVDLDEIKANRWPFRLTLDEGRDAWRLELDRGDGPEIIAFIELDEVRNLDPERIADYLPKLRAELSVHWRDQLDAATAAGNVHLFERPTSSWVELVADDVPIVGIHRSNLVAKT